MDIVSGDAATTRRLVGILGNVSLGSIALAVTLLIVVAALRDRWSAAAAAVTLVVGANVTTQAIKPVSDRTDHGYLDRAELPQRPRDRRRLARPRRTARRPEQDPHDRLDAGLGGDHRDGGGHPGRELAPAGRHPRRDPGLPRLGHRRAGGVEHAARRHAARPSRAAPHLRGHRRRPAAAAAWSSIGVRPDGGWSGFLDASVVLAGIGLVAALAVTTFAQLSAPMAIGEPTQDAPAGQPPVPPATSRPTWPRRAGRRCRSTRRRC